MDIFLVPVILLVVMYATVRSLPAGLVMSAILTGVAAWLTRGGAPASLWNAVGVVGSGLLLGGAGRGRVPPERALFAATLPLTAALAYGALTWERAELARRLDEMVTFQVGESVPAEMRAEMASLLLGLAPASAAIIGYALVLAAYALAVRFFPRLGVRVAPLAPFGQLRLPFGLVWSFAAALLLAIVGRALSARGVFLTGINLAIVHGAAFLVLGMAVGQHAFAGRGMPRGMQWLAGALTLFVMPMPLFVAGVGFADLWLDFRRLSAPPEEDQERREEE
jgi:hypothetical protein